MKFNMYIYKLSVYDVNQLFQDHFFYQAAKAKLLSQSCRYKWINPADVSRRIKFSGTAVSQQKGKLFYINEPKIGSTYCGFCQRHADIIHWKKLKSVIYYYVFHGRVTLFFANNSLMQCRITMKFLHNFF